MNCWVEVALFETIDNQISIKRVSNYVVIILLLMTDRIYM